MTTTAESMSTSLPAVGDIDQNLRSYLRHARAENLAPRTLQAYGEAVGQLGRFLAAGSMPLFVEHITREHVELFIADLLARHKPATAHNRYRGCRAFFRWLAAEGVIARDPMERMKPPRIPEQPVPVLPVADVARLVGAAERDRTFAGVRDAAILRLFWDTGARLAEVAGLRFSEDDPEANDVDLDTGIIRVMGKGRRERVISIDSKTVKALDRYVTRARAKHPAAATEWLWLGRRGRFGETGIGHMVGKRGRAAGLGDHVHAHQLRHSAAHALLAGGMQETEAMRIFGWRDRTMLSRYAASTGTERALAAKRRIAHGDAV